MFTVVIDINGKRSEKDYDDEKKAAQAFNRRVKMLQDSTGIDATRPRGRKPVGTLDRVQFINKRNSVVGVVSLVQKTTEVDPVKLYRNVVQVEILSDEEWDDEDLMNLEAIEYDIRDGLSSGKVNIVTRNQAVSRKKAESILQDHGNPLALFELE